MSESSDSVTPVAGNYFDKYRSRNVVHRLLMKNFITSARFLLQRAAPQRVIEVGAGPGDLACQLFVSTPDRTMRRVEYLGTDISEQQVQVASARYPDLCFRAASAYNLPFADSSADLVLACEVLEHLEQPKRAIEEMARITREFVLISVPWEPVWRILNFARGKYLTHFGNTPGHVSHFSRTAIRELVQRHFEIILERRPIPWTMLLGRIHRPAKQTF